MPGKRGRQVPRFCYLLGAVTALLMSVVSPGVAAGDTTPPSPPQGVFVVQGPDWQSDSQFDLSWDNPVDQESPIAAAHYELCPASPSGPCTVHHEYEEEIDQLTVTLPAPGLFGLRVWLEDQAGNVDPAEKSHVVNLRFDDQAPGLATIHQSGKWLGGDDTEAVDLVIDVNPWVYVPISEIRGYSLTLDGSPPDSSVEATAVQDYLRYPSELVLEDLPEGITEVRARAVSNAGVPSNEVGSSLVRVDRSLPSISATGLPNPSAWSRVPVSVRLTGADQPGLSGMGPAPADEPIEGGGHLAYALDGVAEKVRGGQAALTVSTDGAHTLTYRAVDAAGNASIEKAAEFKIDRSAPTGAFERQDPADPRRLSVSVFDATSGVAGGQVEYRPQGTAKYLPLGTTKVGSKLLAHLDDVALPKGRYELRARVWDHAGNVSILDRWEGGGLTTLALPLRVGTRVEVAGGSTAKTVCLKRAAARRKGKRSAKKRTKRRRCVRKVKIPTTGSAVVRRYGRRTVSTGKLTTIGGLPVPDANVVVEAQLRAGGPFARLGEARTDHLGMFSFAVPPGASRTIRYRFEGTKTIEPSSSQFATRVPAAVRLKPSRRRLLNGQAVVFRGRLLGKPVPSAGKVVALQAKVGRRWRTFATPRANGRGVFRHRYRFTATTGLRRYVFRAVATREAAYSYERGVSRKVAVVVRGR